MRIHNAIVLISALLLTSAAFTPLARADEWNQMTEFSFNNPVEIPGRILPAGKYWFVLATNSSDRNIVQVFSADWSKLYATVQTIATYRSEPTVDTEVRFAERPSRQPEALLKWYYPGRLIGHQFLYRTKNEREFARDAKQDVVVTSLLQSAA